MKKFFMTLAVVMIAVCANAQVYLGGNVGIASVDYGGDDDETIYIQRQLGCRCYVRMV